MNGDNVALTFVSRIMDHRHNPPTNLDVTVLRLVMPREALRATALFIDKLLVDMEAGSTPSATNTRLN
ncbi:MAG TPA: hypothetical protein VIJ94_04255 [Caulobacteraceae bacterium]